MPFNRVSRAALAGGSLMVLAALALPAWAEDAPAAADHGAAHGAAATAAAKPAGTTPAGTTVVARVDGAEIHYADVAQTIAGLPQQIRDMPEAVIFSAVLEQLINAKLVAAAAVKAKLADDPEVKDKLRRAEERALQEAYLSRRVHQSLSEDQLKQRYTKYLAENPPQDEVRASHILVASEAEAKDIIKQLKGGADFAKLAKDKSTDTAAAAQGGDLGYFSHDAMVPAFSDAAFALKAGEVSAEPVKTQFGWHVIKVADHRQSAAPTFEAIRPTLESDASQEAISSIIDELRSHAKVEQFQADGSPLPAAAPAGAPTLVPAAPEPTAEPAPAPAPAPAK